MNLKSSNNRRDGCEICGCRLREGRWYEPFMSYFVKISKPKPMLVMDVQDEVKASIIFLCEEDNKWVNENHSEAEALLRTKLHLQDNAD